MIEDDNKWQAESDASTLIQAAEIKRDKKRLQSAMKLLKEKQSATDAAVTAAKGTKGAGA